MPIKFRCKHCQQFLGISRSRAGAIVDCPQCGRSVRVPDLDGRIRKLPDAQVSAKTDSSLISALSELSALGSLESDETGSPEETHGHTAVAAVKEKQTAVALDPLPVADPVHVEVEHQSESHEEVWDEDVSDEPAEVQESLSELAALENSATDDPVSTELLEDMRTVPSRTNVATLLVGGSAILLLGLAVGWWLRKKFEPLSQPESLPPAVAANDADKAAVVGAVEKPTLFEVKTTVSGIVEYQSAAGQLLPDAGATVLLLPSERHGELKFDARSLTRAEDDPDRMATVAGLVAIGASLTVADDKGAYELSTFVGEPVSVIVVSKHVERPADVEVEQHVETFLRQYFESPNHVCGKLAVQRAESDSGVSEQSFRFHARP